MAGVSVWRDPGDVNDRGPAGLYGVQGGTARAPLPCERWPLYSTFFSLRIDVNTVCGSARRPFSVNETSPM